MCSVKESRKYSLYICSFLLCNCTASVSVPFRNGHELAHKPKFSMNFGQFGAQEPIFRKCSFPEHLLDFGWLGSTIWSQPFKLSAAQHRVCCSAVRVQWVPAMSAKGGGDKTAGNPHTFSPGCSKL